MQVLPIRGELSAQLHSTHKIAPSSNGTFPMSCLSKAFLHRKLAPGPCQVKAQYHYELEAIKKNGRKRLQLKSFKNIFLVQISDGEDYLMALPGFGYKCQACHYESRSKYNVQRHIQTFHIRTETFVCHICLRCFYTENNRQIHVKRGHKIHLSMKALREKAEDVKTEPH